MTKNFISVSFLVRDKGGASAGSTISVDAPEFNWEDFKNTPNAEEFAKKAYFAAVKKIAREINERKNGTTKSDLSSVEAVIARSLSFTQDEIRKWFETRDWTKANQVRDIATVLPKIEKSLLILASRQNPFSAEASEKIAYKIIASVADDQDPIADFLFTILTTSRSDEELLSL